MKIATVVGARPQFIKAAVVSRELRKKHEEILIHTGQHYDYNMSDIFFKELAIPHPSYNLGISGGSHGKMTCEMLIKIEEVLLKEKPCLVILYGDTNSTLAGAVAASKLHIPICHVEAGVRMKTLNNPEEINRIMTDHVSSILMCCTQSSIKALKDEGISKNVHWVGDPMYDAFNFYSRELGNDLPENLMSIEGEKIVLPEKYYYMTCHREENTGSDEPLKQIFEAMNSLSFPCVYPVHPRNRSRARRLKNAFKYKNIILCEPVGYLTSIYLLLHSEKVVTDSGGLQREAFFAQKQCITIFDHIIWPETMVNNRNQLSSPQKDEIIEKINTKQKILDFELPFGAGDSGEKIVRLIDSYLDEKCREGSI